MYRNRLYIRCYNYTEHAVTIRLGVDPDHAARAAAGGVGAVATRLSIQDTRQGRRDRFWFFWNDIESSVHLPSPFQSQSVSQSVSSRPPRSPHNRLLLFHSDLITQLIPLPPLRPPPPPSLISDADAESRKPFAAIAGLVGH
jgi:hypothetical protein